jgi:hypothetical protein
LTHKIEFSRSAILFRKGDLRFEFLCHFAEILKLWTNATIENFSVLCADSFPEAIPASSKLALLADGFAEKAILEGQMSRIWRDGFL